MVRIDHFEGYEIFVNEGKHPHPLGMEQVLGKLPITQEQAIGLAYYNTVKQAQNSEDITSDKVPTDILPTTKSCC